MRTKHLLWAFTLPAVFAACQSDDFEVISQENSALQNRPMAGQVEFNFGMTEAATRLNSQFQFETGDQIGATLMDEYKEDKSGDAIAYSMGNNCYKFVDYIQTNYRYTLNSNGEWENANLLCSGNYFMYYPYMTELNTRKAFEKYLNPNQVLTENTSAAARDMVNDNQMYVGYKFVEGATEGDKQVLDVVMEPVFAFPLFVINSRDAGDVEIQKIALQYKDKNKDMPLRAIIDPSDANHKKAVEVTISGKKYYDYEKNPIAAVEMTTDNTGTLVKNAVTSARQIQVTFPEGTVTNNNTPVNAYMVIPAGDYTKGATEDNTVELLIYTNRGIVTADLGAVHENKTGSDQYAVTNDVAMGEVYGDPELMEGGNYRVINITFDEVAIVKPETFTATSTEDLDTYLGWFNEIGGGQNLTVNSTGTNVEISKYASEILKNNTQLKVTVNGDITLAKDVVSDVWNYITFSGNSLEEQTSTDAGGETVVTPKPGQTVVNKGNITISKNINNTNLTIDNDGTITLSNTSYNNTFKNDGTLNVNRTGNGSVSIQGDVTNNKYMNINATPAMGVTFSKVIENNGGAMLTVAEDAMLNAGINNNKNSSKGTFGGIIVSGIWNVTAESTSNGLIQVNGTLKVNNDAKLTNNEKWYYTAGKNWITPQIDNYGNITGVTNNGLVVQATENASYISTDQAGTGRVDNTVISQRTVACATETIQVTVDEAANVKVLNDKLNRAQAEAVVFDYAGSLSVEADDVAEGETTIALNIPVVDIYGNLRINVAEGITLIINETALSGTTLNINSGTTSINAGAHVKLGNDSYGSYINVGEGAILDVENRATLESISIEFSGDGLVRNYGTIKSADKGTMEWEGVAPTK